MSGFMRELALQRWDDHRFYHHSRINQSLHFLSAGTFVGCYAYAFIDPALATVVAWLVAMTSRQTGHLFFEPRGYDDVNHATDEHKEEIKVGYNIRRKIVLLAVWAFSPLVLLVEPTLFGLYRSPMDAMGFARRLGAIWLAVGVGGLAFRTIHLFFLKGVQSGLVWATKIVTDPFHDLYLYHAAPLALLRGELIENRRGADHDAWDEDDAEPAHASL